MSEPIRTIDEALAFLCENRFIVTFDSGTGSRSMQFDAVIDSHEASRTVHISREATAETCAYPPLQATFISLVEDFRKRVDGE